jgi:Asp-tRNAAsn/Glu-tRNAGln amidotransferase B subunit (PET112 homolog)
MSTSTAAGVALMEIVSKPDIRDAEQAKAYVTKLRSILRYLGTCDGDMEKGSLRADVNVSVRKPGGPLGTRCEIKNMNSINFIGQAIEYEARRQIEIIEDGGDRSGDPAVRPQQGRDALDALQGRGARLPLFPRSRSLAARGQRGLRRKPEG